MFFFSPLFYRSFPIFRHNFYIKRKKKRAKVDSARNPPPPHCGTKSIQMFFFFFLNFPKASNVIPITNQSTFQTFLIVPRMIMKLIIIPNVLVWSQGFQKGICPVSMAESQPKQVNSLIPIFFRHCIFDSACM